MVTCQILSKIVQLIHGFVTVKNCGFSCAFTAVYGLHTVETRKPLWSDLIHIHGTGPGSWLVMGGFNSILFSGDRLNGSPVTNAEIRDFEHCIDNNDLGEIKSCCHYYSWNNKGHRDQRVCTRIDRAFGNADWHTAYTDVVVDYLNPGLSDHSPLLMSYNMNMQKGGRPFNFFNYMANHQDFNKVVQEGWGKKVHGTALFQVWQKLKYVKMGLKALHTMDLPSYKRE